MKHIGYCHGISDIYKTITLAPWHHSFSANIHNILQVTSLTYKVLTTAQPCYLRNLISVDSPYIETRSSSSVTLSRPSSSSSLKITDRSFHLQLAFGINFLPHSVNLILISLFLTLLNLSSSVSSSPLSLSITPTLFQDTFSLNPSRHRHHPFHRTAFTDTWLLNGFLFSFSINLFVWFVQ